MSHVHAPQSLFLIVPRRVCAPSPFSRGAGGPARRCSAPQSAPLAGPPRFILRRRASPTGILAVRQRALRHSFARSAAVLRSVPRQATSRRPISRLNPGSSPLDFFPFRTGTPASSPISGSLTVPSKPPSEFGFVSQTGCERSWVRFACQSPPARPGGAGRVGAEVALAARSAIARPPAQRMFSPRSLR